MKYFLSLLLILAVMLCGCTGAPAEGSTVAETLTPAESAPTQETQPIVQKISQEMAMLEGYVVIEDGDVRHNQLNWTNFLEITMSGSPSSIRIMHFYDSEAGFDQICYDVSFDGTRYTVSDGKSITETASELSCNSGELDDSAEPYDRYIRYSLNEIVLYQDLIAEPDFDGVTEIAFHAKEGEPAVQTYIDEASVTTLLALLSGAEYLPADPIDYLYCMKLIMVNGDGKELIIELDYRYGNFRYGTQTYHYGELTDLFTALGIEQWPETVIKEFDAYLNGTFQENLNS